MPEEEHKAAEHKMTEAEHEEAKDLAEDLKRKKGVRNPHSLANWVVQKKRGK